MDISDNIMKRIRWFEHLYKVILTSVRDEDVAKAIFKTILFEENLR